MKKWLKAELHTHTREDPSDGQSLVVHSPQQLIDAAAAQGFELLAITNHNQLLFEEGLDDYAREKGILLFAGSRSDARRKSHSALQFLGL